MIELTQKDLKRQLRYKQTTGEFIWRVSNSNRTKVGDVAGGTRPDGYVQLQVNNKRHLAHRLAWFYVKGFFPNEIEIDHINRNPSDNRWKNLRLVSRQCNLRNAKKQCNNKSGVTGVFWNTRDKKWSARIKINSKNYSIANSDNFDEAVLYRLAVEQCLNWEGCNSSSLAYLYAKKHKLIKKRD